MSEQQVVTKTYVTRTIHMLVGQNDQDITFTFIPQRRGLMVDSQDEPGKVYPVWEGGYRAYTTSDIATQGWIENHQAFKEKRIWLDEDQEKHRLDEKTLRSMKLTQLRTAVQNYRKTHPDLEKQYDANGKELSEKPIISYTVEDCISFILENNVPI